MGTAVEIGAVGERVAANIQRLRVSRSWSLADLSRMLEAAGRVIPKSGLFKIEAGERRVDVDDLSALCRVFDVDPAVMMGDKPKPTPFTAAISIAKADRSEVPLPELVAEIERMQRLATECHHLERLLTSRMTGEELAAYRDRTAPDAEHVIAMATAAIEDARNRA